MGLMLAKIMGRAGDIGVRRALGASRARHLAQCLIETGVVGLAGGILGLGLTALGLMGLRSLLEEVALLDAPRIWPTPPLPCCSRWLRPSVADCIRPGGPRMYSLPGSSRLSKEIQMELRPILSAMRRNKFGALLIATQMAVTLAILSNAFHHRAARRLSGRPSGMDEKNLFVITTVCRHPRDLAARASADVAALRRCPAWSTPTRPTCILQNGGWIERVSLDARSKDATRGDGELHGR